MSEEWLVYVPKELCELLSNLFGFMTNYKLHRIKLGSSTEESKVSFKS